MNRSSSMLVSALVLCTSAALPACAGSEDPSQGTGGAPTDDATGGGDTGEGGGDSGEGGAGNGEGGGSGIVEGAPASCIELGGAEPDADYPGFDDAWLADGVAPAGCEGELEPGRTWTLRLDGSVSTLRLSFAGDIVHANGVACTAADGTQARVSAETRLRVVGSTSAERVVLDLVDGTPSALDWTSSTGLVLELGGGEDKLVVRGAPTSDSLALRTNEGQTFLDFDGDLAPDVIAHGLVSVVVAAGPGDDEVDAYGWDLPLSIPIAICGGAGADGLRGGSAVDRIEGGSGDDRIVAAEQPDGADLVSGGDGHDCADFGARTDGITVSLDDDADDGAVDEGDNVLQDVEWIIGGAGSDRLIGSSRADRIEGLAGDDQIEGRGGDDVLLGGDGDDTFIAASDGDGADYMEGGPGIDAASYAGRATGVDVTLCMTDPLVESCSHEACSCAANDGAPGEGDRILDIEVVHGTEGADRMVGTAGDDVFYGYGGDDQMIGLAGNDSMYGDEGDDQLDAAEGDDFLDGSLGVDIFDAGSGDGDICIVEPGESPGACELY